MRSSLVETSSSASSFFFVAFFGIFCSASTENGMASAEPATAEVPIRKSRRDVFMAKSSMRMRIACGAHPYEQYNSGGMLPVNGSKKLRFAIERNLRAQSGCETGDQWKVVIIAHGVSLYASEESFVEAWRFCLFPQQQFASAVRAFDSCPHVVVLGKLQRRFRQIAVRDPPALQYAIATPQQRGRPTTFRQWTVVAD